MEGPWPPLVPMMFRHCLHPLQIMEPPLESPPNPDPTLLRFSISQNLHQIRILLHSRMSSIPDISQPLSPPRAPQHEPEQFVSGAAEFAGADRPASGEFHVLSSRPVFRAWQVEQLDH